MITTSRTMPESDFTPEELTSEKKRARSFAHQEAQSNSQFNPGESLLNSFELQTVLDMLAVMEAVEELDQLQALTEAQKRQVWEATPESLKQKLWQLRNQPNRDRSADNLNSGRSAETVKNEAQNDDQDEYLENHYESDSARQADLETDLEDEIEDLGQDLELTADSYPATATGITGKRTGSMQPGLAAAAPSQTSPFAINPSNPTVVPEVGSWVILRAHPRLNSAELKAVWQLRRIEGNTGEVYDATLGVRSYPLSWMVIYAKAEPADLELSLENPHKGEEDF